MYIVHFLKSIVGGVGNQLLSNSWRLIILLFFATTVLIGAYILSLLTSYHPEDFTRDVVATAGLPSYIGVISNLGIIGWTSTATICLLGAIVLPEYRAFLLSSSLLSALLGVDDLFLLHENVLPDIIPGGEMAIYLFYMLALGIYLIIFAKTIFSHDYIWYILAMVSLGASLVLDQVLPVVNTITFIEDSFKFFGIIFWTMYFFTTVQKLIVSRIQVRDQLRGQSRTI